MAKPILDLSTVITDRPPIRVDGVTYHLKSPDELTLMGSHQFAAWGEQLRELGEQGEEGIGELEQLLPKVVEAIAFDIPTDVLGKLSTANRMAIVEVFTGLLLSVRLRSVEANVRAALPTGASSSRVSSISSAAARSGGSPAPRSGSSGRM